MTICNVTGLNKAYVTQQVLEDISFKINSTDKTGIIGVNGAGKTTLFRILCGTEEADSGSIFKEKGLSVAYMQQHSDFSSSKSPKEELEDVFSDLIALETKLEESAEAMKTDHSEKSIARHLRMQEKFEQSGGLTYKSRITAVLYGLGFTDSEASLPLSALSGGQRTRVLLAKILLSDAKLILLDEPTNHLDINSTLWLEDFLINYKDALMIISHDRFFLDRITNRIFEIENQRLKEYNGNYTAYKEQKALDRLTQERDYERKQKEIKRIEGIIAQQKTFSQERNYITIKSKQKQIDRIEAEMVAPDRDPDEIGFDFKACSGTGNDVLILDSIAKSYSEKRLFSGIDLLLKKEEKVFLTGTNGCGKTTLLKIIVGQENPDRGSIKLGARVKIGYYDQSLSGIDDEKTIFDEVADAYPKMTNTEVRKALAVFLFKNDDVFKKIGTLSGGEKARVCLVKLMLSDVNLLIMDEPTNHLDIASKEALEKALSGYDGTLIVVSHDRYFINSLSSKILNFENGSLKEYSGNYDDFLSRTASSDIAIKKEKAGKGGDYRERKEKQAEERKRANRIAALEKEISMLEEEIALLQFELEKPEIAEDYKKIMEISSNIEEKQKKITELYSEWEELNL